MFGYDNVRVNGHVERRINEPQAVVVRRMFELSASGMGYLRIARLLNDEQALAPSPQQSRPVGWSPSSVYEVVHRPLDRGEVVWNKTKKRDAGGKTAPTARPESEWLRLYREDLRVVSDAVTHVACAPQSQDQTTMMPWPESADTDTLMRRSFPFSDANAAASSHRLVHDFMWLLKT